MYEARKKRKAKKINKIMRNEPAFSDSRISMEFDIFRYVSIFPMSFGHKLGTKLKEECSDEHRRKNCPYMMFFPTCALFDQGEVRPSFTNPPL